MQLLEETDYLEDPYGNTLFDSPIRKSNEYGFDNEKIYIGTLQLEHIDLQVIQNYYSGLYKEEIVTKYYPLKRGNNQGDFWHQYIGDSWVTKDGFLCTEIWYGDSLQNRIDGYFVTNAIDLDMPPFGFADQIVIKDILSFYEKKSNREKLKIMLGLKSSNINKKEIDSWKKEPIGNYLLDIIELIKEEDFR
ncbi:MAG: hypothetical protein Q4C49_14275 [Bacillota bacterium]|nr:hypothetical protein [Bacillota bacterium]